MSDLQKALAEPDDPRPLIEQALDLLSEDDRDAIEQALASSQYPSSQIANALAMDGKVRDAGKVPAADSIYKYRRRKGWI